MLKDEAEATKEAERVKYKKLEVTSRKNTEQTIYSRLEDLMLSKFRDLERKMDGKKFQENRREITKTTAKAGNKEENIPGTSKKTFREH